MCGRFTRAYTWRELVALYGLTQPALNLQPRYNIGPTATIDVLIPRNSDQLELWPMGWGLIPSWWTKTRLRLRRQGGVKSLAVCLNSGRNRNHCCRELTISERS